MKLRSILKPEASTMAAIATAGTVYAVYNLNVGSASQAHATQPNHPSLESARKKAGYTAFVLVSGLFLVTRDGNVATFGYASIIAMEIVYRHSIMAEPSTGKIVPPSPAEFTPASESYLSAVPNSDTDTAVGY